MKNLRLRLLSLLVIAYMIVAFTWWTLLLFKKNEDARDAKTYSLWLVMVADGHVENEEEFKHTNLYLNLQEDYKRQEYMIMGEALFFVVSLVIGIWLINRSYHREIETATQQRTFLLSITHELKSPIASIRLVLETFVKRLSKLNPEQSNRLTNSALQEIDRLNELVNNLLLAAKVETAYIPTKEAIDLSNLFQEVIEKLRTKYPQVNFLFSKQTEEVEIQADKLGMSSIAFNLLENAIKYGEGEKQIGIDLERQNGSVLLAWCLRNFIE